MNEVIADKFRFDDLDDLLVIERDDRQNEDETEE